MIITGEHPDAKHIKIYDRFGNILGGIMEVDTHKMEGKKFLGFDSITGAMIIEKIIVYKIKGPGTYIKRKPKRSRVLNTNRRQ